MSDAPTSPSSSTRSSAPAPARAYETPTLERFGTFRELTQAGGGGNCDPSLVLGPETGNGNNLARCYD